MYVISIYFENSHYYAVLQVRKLNAMLGPKDSTSTARFEPEWLDGCDHGARKGHNVS